ncbi:hypothetical protein CFOL_v3_32839 [Cephalotus follicularis]|uniref:Uncharacterized protein n=1 Tax=Cephalotus follicularis TaxID=3775 RepID=A0A1Q3DAB9_CEPFO|nr:hypothetical protein CFOL_v3_32839 [Cephalotus follicularis]
MTKFRQGVLPVKYLGLPLITTRLKKRDCKSVTVKWTNVCLPRQESGLGIKSLKDWNQALLLKQIWSILNDHSLWVQCCKLNLI